MSTTNKELQQFRKQVRSAFAVFYANIGCGFCGDRDERRKAEAVLGKLLGVARYKDGSGFDFYKYLSNKGHE